MLSGGLVPETYQVHSVPQKLPKFGACLTRKLRNSIKHLTASNKRVEFYWLEVDHDMFDNKFSWIHEAENRFHALRSKKCYLHILLKEKK